jgi:hypothetical protein
MNDEMVFAIIPLFAIVFGCATIIGAIWLGMKARMRRIETTTELQSRVLDKFGTSSEFVEFVRTPEGRQWMTASTESETRQADRILSSLRWGLVATAFGGAFLVLAAIDERDLVYPGFLIGSIGIGFLSHSLLAAKLARRWGLMPRESPGRAEE